jgi:hypothetical protein
MANANGRNPLDYDYSGSRLQTPTEILNYVDHVSESISVDEEVMRFIVNQSVNELWGNVIVTYESGSSDNIAAAISQITKNGNYYHDETVNQFIQTITGPYR